jgi:protein ImuB
MILVNRVGQHEVVTAACPVAKGLGLHPGMAGAHARALVTDLYVRDAEPDDDQAVLDRLALHAVAHWTPSASPCPPDGLWLDLTGTAHLFGGEARFGRRLIGFLRRLGFSSRIGIAGTPGAAHALARYGKDAMTIVANGDEAEAIAGMPLACLRLDAPALVAAARFGLERVADLYPMPRGPLVKRLGRGTVLRLDQARGMVAEPIVPVTPFEEPWAERRLLEPIGTADALHLVISDLVDELGDQLQIRMLGVRTVALDCERVDGVRQHIVVGTARATRDVRHLKRMLAMRIERIDPGLGIERMTLAASRVETLLPTPFEAALGDRPLPRDLASLIDQLAGRVAPDALFRLTAVESDVPERAVLRTQPLGSTMGWPAWKRPARLLPRPEPLMNVIALLPDHPPRRFAWRGTYFEVARGDGPERIHGEWWRSARELWAVRDYFRVETTAGDRFWIFRRGDGVDAPTGDLSWHMHGFFG